MKNTLLNLLFFLIICPIVSAQKKQVSRAEAIHVARSWIHNNYPQLSSEGALSYSINNHGDTLLFEYATDSVSIILSGHKGCRPILARQKFQGSLLSQRDSLPGGVQFFLDSYREEINACFEDGTRNEGYEHEWDILTNTVQEPQRIIYIVRPLVKTHWGQSLSNDFIDTFAYNYYIRPGINCNHCVVGCGAVAMAQVMNYWQYPIVRKSSRQFDWCNMTNYLSTTDYYYEKEKKAIAYLMFICAEFVSDSFTCSETFSKMRDIRDRLIDWDYNSNIAYKKKQNYSSSNWEMMIKNDLDNNLPIIYRGEGSGKHIFVCDGYSNDGLFHFNWGSVNVDPGDFALSAITPSNFNNQFDFTNKQEALFKIKPNTIQSICSVHLNLDFFYSSNIPLLIDFFPYEIVPQTMTTLTSASVSSPSAWRTIPNGATALYQAHKEINLQDGFEAELGCEFEARIEPCEQCDELGENILSGDEENEDFENGNDNEMLYSAGKPTQAVATDLFPNPTDGPLTMLVDSEAQDVFVFTLDGRPVGGWRLTAHTKTAVTLDVSPLAPAAYLLSVRTSSGLHTARFIRQ